MQKVRLNLSQLGLIFLVFLTFSPQKVFALEETLTPLRDLYIKPGGSETHGYKPTLLIEHNEPSSYKSYTYIIFDLKLLPGEAIIDQAGLSLVLLDSDVHHCDVHAQRQGEPWNENENYFSLGYNNTGVIYDITYVADPGKYEWDISQLMTEWQNGKYDNYGVVMYASAECRKSFGSRQNDNQDAQPKLTVTYHLPPTATPTPTTTSTPTPTPSTKPSPTLLPTQEVILTPSSTPTISLTPTPSPRPGRVFGGSGFLAALLVVIGSGLILFVARKKAWIKWPIFRKDESETPSERSEDLETRIDGETEEKEDLEK